MKQTDFKLLSDWPDCDYDVAGIILQDKRGRICLQLRDNFDYVSGAGKWSFFGDHVESGESWRDAVIRELEEEIGVKADPDQFAPYARLVPDGGLQAYHYYFRLARPVEPNEIRLSEGAGFGFWDVKDIPLDLTLDSAQIILTDLLSEN